MRAQGDGIALVSALGAAPGGKFFRATDTASFQSIHAEVDHLEKTTHQLRKFEHHQELLGRALVPAMVLFGIGLGLEETRFRRLP